MLASLLPILISKVRKIKEDQPIKIIGFSLPSTIKTYFRKHF